MKKIVVLIFCILLLSVCCFAYDFDGYVVKLKDNTAEIFSESFSLYDEASLFSEMNDEDFAGFLIEEVQGVDDVASHRGFVKVNDEDALNELVSLGLVEYFEENIYYDLYGYDVEANPGLSSQWYIDAINADFAWNAGVYGDGVNVSVIDSGVSKNSDLLANLLEGVNYDTQSGTSCNHDTAEHGTPIAGIIAAECNGTGTVGIAFKSKVLPMRVINNEGRVSLSNAVSAIYDSVDIYGCKVINLSFGSSKINTSLYNAILDAINEGVIVVAASGNIVNNDTSPKYPAYHAEVISVANVQRYGSSYRISSTSIYNENVDIAAPGSSLLSTVNSTSGTSTYSGTSFACPVVVAAAALVKSVDPDITQSEFELLIKETANASYITTSGQTTNHWGAGLLDIKSMLRSMLFDEKYYVSDIYTVDDENFVSITNMTNSNFVDCVVSISEENKPTKVLNLSLSPAESIEISLTEEGFTSNAVINKETINYGDVNADGEVNIRDASLVLRFCAGYDVGMGSESLDVNGDGDVNIRDASAILRYCAGYQPELN